LQAKLAQISAECVTYFNDLPAFRPIMPVTRERNRGRVMPEPGPPQAAEIARKEINLLLGLAEQAGVDNARLRDELRLSQSDWPQWLGILHHAPLPPRPELPLMLRHLGYLTSRLDRATRPAYA
jgi:hypothetical protein